MSDTEREEADKGADAQAAGVCCRQQSPGRGAEPLRQNECHGVQVKTLIQTI